MRLILDFDATDDAVHGQQEGRFFHDYYGHYCLLRATRGRTRIYQGTKDPVSCHWSPTEPCVGGNPGVRSARDTVASA